MRINQSRMNMHLRCGEQDRRRYEEGEIIPPGIALIRGSSVHKGAEENNKHILASGKEIKKVDLIKLVRNEFSKRIKAEGIYLTKEEKFQKKTVIENGKNEAMALTGVFADEVSPTIEPVKIEMPFEIEFKENILHGRIDLVDKKGLRDLKTSNKKKNQGEVDDSDQLSMYTLGYKFLFGKMPKTILMDVLVATKTPKYQPLTTKRTLKDIDVFLRRLYAVIEGIKKGVFLPTKPENWWCGEKWCGYYSTCKYRS